MTRLIRLTNDADTDLVSIAEYIATDNITAAIRFVAAVRRQFETLRLFPNAGARRTRVPRDLKGLRSWPVGGAFRKYLILYIPHEHEIEIVRVLHGARNIQRILRDRSP